ncbi:hypothetical protein D3C84_452380 [compost metagenome]
MTQLVKRRFIKALLLTSAFVGSSACSSLNMAVPEFESFTLVGELPTDFSSKITATYRASLRENCTRPFYSYGRGADVSKVNQHFAEFETERNAQPQQIRQKIPLNYKLEGCTLRLTSIYFKVVGHYGPDPEFDNYPSGGTLMVYDKRPEQAPPFPENGILEVRGFCTWKFQTSSLNFGIDKLLSCHTADEQWQVAEDFWERRSIEVDVGRNELSGKTIRMEFRVNPEEKPSRDKNWIKFAEGWKLCSPKEGWQRCQEPPIFKTFKMNGRECTVYPNCTE